MTAIIQMPRTTWLERTMTTVGEALVRAAEQSRARRADRRTQFRAAEYRDTRPSAGTAMDDCIVRAWRSGIR